MVIGSYAPSVQESSLEIPLNEVLSASTSASSSIADLRWTCPPNWSREGIVSRGDWSMKTEEFQQRVEEIRNRHSALVPFDMRFAVEAGWLPLIDETLGRLEELLRAEGELENSGVRQIKEKFGALRIYVRPHHGSWPDSTSRGTLAIVAEAQKRSAEQCEICGRTGQIEVIDHYHQTLCMEHASKWREWVAMGRPDVDWR